MPKYPYRYNLHPLLKLAVFTLLNVLAFLPQYQTWRWGVLIIEIFLGWLIKLRWNEIKGAFRFLFINFIGLYILFYFVDFNWFSALIIFGNYAISILVLFLGAFIFNKSTPPRELLTALRMIHIPQGLSIAFTIAITFLPLLTQNIRQVIAMQQARGYHVHLIHLGPIIIPSLLNIIDLSTNLAISMEARGFEMK